MKEIDKIKKLELNPEINRLKKENNQLKFVIDVSTRVHEYYSKNGIDIRKLAKLFMEKFSDLTLDKAFGYAKDVSDGLAISLLLNTSIDIRCENMMMYCEEKQISKKYTELDEDVKAFIRYTYVIELLENFNTGKGE